MIVAFEDFDQASIVHVPHANRVIRGATEQATAPIHHHTIDIVRVAVQLSHQLVRLQAPNLDHLVPATAAYLIGRLDLIMIVELDVVRV